jgi:heme-degrading monooxygenase HmoA
MYAAVVKVTVDDPESATQELREQVVPRVSGAPGFVAGYWTRKENSGLSMTIWESEDEARSASDRIRELAPTGVTIDDIELREVVANA